MPGTSFAKFPRCCFDRGQSIGTSLDYDRDFRSFRPSIPDMLREREERDSSARVARNRNADHERSISSRSIVHLGAKSSSTVSLIILMPNNQVNLMTTISTISVQTIKIYEINFTMNMNLIKMINLIRKWVFEIF